MVIDTTSREGMESSLAHLMGVSVPELYQYIEAAADSAVEGQWCFNQDLFDKAMEDFYSDTGQTRMVLPCMCLAH